MGTAIGVLTAALVLALMGLPWELHFSAHHMAAVAVVLTGITVVAQGVVLVVDLLVGTSAQAPSPRSSPSAMRRAGPGRCVGR